MSRISKNNISCELCLNSAGFLVYNPTLKFAQFVLLKCYRHNTLFFVNNATFEFFHQMEIIIRQYVSYLKRNFDANKYDLITFLKEIMHCVSCDTLKNCHNIKNKIMIRFIRFRLQIENNKSQLPNKIYNSKTMAMHATVR